MRHFFATGFALLLTSGLIATGHEERHVEAQTRAGGPRTLDITVREGTSMAIALSPDRTRVAIDLQGGLWTVPIGGGRATRITDEYGDARQPS